MSGALRRLAFAVGLVIASIAALLLRGDAEPPDDADLKQASAPVADYDNGNVTLAAASELLRWPEDEVQAAQLEEMASGAAWDAELANRALAENEFALQTFARVARNSAFQSSPAESGERPTFAVAIRLSRLLAIRAIRAARGSDCESAIESALLAVRIGAKITSDPHGMLATSAAGFLSSEAGLNALSASLRLCAFGGARSAALAEELRSLRSDVPAWQQMLANEYRAESARIVGEHYDGLAQEARRALAPRADSVGRIAAWLPDSYLAQPNRTLALLAAETRKQQAAAGEPCRATAAAAEPLSLRDLLQPNAFGRRRVHGALRARADMLRCAHDARLELARVAIAVTAFERERGVLPPAIEALVPAYLSAAPVDPFLGGSLHFDRAQRVLYSIGSDGTDGGGRERFDDVEAREPRLLLPAPPSR